MRIRRTARLRSGLKTATILGAVFFLVSAAELYAESGIITYKGGAVYEGELLDALPSGKGRLIWPDGRMYTGEFLEGKFNGEGAYIFPSGIRYTGAFTDGKFHGRGTLHYRNGIVYDGEFLNDKRHGYGTLVYPGDRKHDGKVQGKGDGQGPNVPSVGNTYAGEFRNDRKHGQGTFTWASGTKYTGEFRNGVKSGQGTTVFADGRIYTGEYRNDRINGIGTLTWPNGDAYTGEFRNGKRHGIGVYTWAGGNKRTGRYEHGQFIEVVKDTPKSEAVQPVTHAARPAAATGSGTDGEVTPGDREFPVHFTLRGREYSKTPPKSGFLGQYIYNGDATSGQGFPERYVVFKDNGEGIFMSPEVARKTEWGVEIEEGQPKIFTARDKKLHTGTAYRIAWKCLTRCENAQPNHTFIMVDTDESKALIDNSVYTKVE